MLYLVIIFVIVLLFTLYKKPKNQKPNISELNLALKSNMGEVDFEKKFGYNWAKYMNLTQIFRIKGEVVEKDLTLI